MLKVQVFEVANFYFKIWKLFAEDFLQTGIYDKT